MTFVVPSEWSCGIAHRMHKYHISVKDIAERANLSRVYVSQLLNAAEEPEIGLKKRISRAVLELSDECKTKHHLTHVPEDPGIE